MIVYKITNIINSKIYVGQTIGSLKTRFTKHCRKNSGCPYLSNSILKHGKDSFRIEILETCINQRHLDTQEQYWITYYKSNNSDHGYNLTSGGKFFTLNPETKSKRVTQLRSIRKKHTRSITVKNLATGLSLDFNSIIEASQYLKCNSSSITSHIGKSFIKAYRGLWAFKYTENNTFSVTSQLHTYYNAKWIVGINSDTLQIFSSLSKSHKHGFKSFSVSRHLNTNTFYKGFKWYAATPEFFTHLTAAIK